MTLNYSLIESQDKITTKGLASLVGREFSVRNRNYPDGYVRAIINYIVTYIETENKYIEDQETMGVGSWMIKFVLNKSVIELHELKNVFNGLNEYEFDLTLTINFYSEQSEFCSGLQIHPHIPRIGQKIAVSEEVFEGSEVSGVRYKAPDHMSGWYLTSNSYNGDINSLTVDHLYFILKKRPDLAKFLALPVGYRFYIDGDGYDVWLDEEISTALE